MDDRLTAKEFMKVNEIDTIEKLSALTKKEFIEKIGSRVDSLFNVGLFYRWYDNYIDVERKDIPRCVLELWEDQWFIEGYNKYHITKDWLNHYYEIWGMELVK